MLRTLGVVKLTLAYFPFSSLVIFFTYAEKRVMIIIIRLYIYIAHFIQELQFKVLYIKSIKTIIQVIKPF